MISPIYPQIEIVIYILKQVQVHFIMNKHVNAVLPLPFADFHIFQSFLKISLENCKKNKNTKCITNLDPRHWIEYVSYLKK